ncbi:LARGE xylosyl- and glucuronyltransferase 2-A isoform X1 [Tetranychus urticae]|uniref:LARGE xylosyl- and glucuronyltransferase 2-A isoform X1 n=1 Tax=Tetranychus urticae TaxID=32264 RepID=UPI00077BB2FB|nr:LARGE xylosyl- and glucuronyltransferase 2-A isoform X1 [Tetranychus urticae]
MLITKLYKLFARLSRGTSSFQIVLISIGLHCLASILIIYFHLSQYLDESRRSEPFAIPKQGGITLHRRIDGVNLIVNDIIDEKNITYHGWWLDHYKFHHSIQCFESKLVKCVTVFSTECKIDGVRAMYQYIPIKRGYPLTSIEISLKSFAPHLTEQTDEGVYGLHALIHLTSGQSEYARINFPANLDDWTKRTTSYSTPPGTSIVEITIMVLCFGYTGTVSFSEILIVPNELKATQKRNDLVADCVSDGYEDRPLSDSPKCKTINFPLPEPTDKFNEHSITLITQVSMDRISILEKTLSSWDGPVSISIFVPINNTNEGLKDWQSLYLEKKLRKLQLCHKSSISIMLCPTDDQMYPINKMRNIAIANAKTRFIMLLDADFQPSPDLEKEFVQNIQGIDVSSKAFVVPAFEYVEAPKVNEASPRNKEELLQLIFREDPLINPFRLTESVDAHKLTNYWKWYSSSKTFPVIQFSDKYEPYLILEKTKNMPLFDERFSGYGMNKVTHTTELFASHYTLSVLPKAWVIHLPHRPSTYNQDFLQNSDRRLRNRAQRFQFIKNIIEKYKIKQTAC